MIFENELMNGRVHSVYVRRRHVDPIFNFCLYIPIYPEVGVCNINVYFDLLSGSKIRGTTSEKESKLLCQFHIYTCICGFLLGEKLIDKRLRAVLFVKDAKDEYFGLPLDRSLGKY